MGFLVNPYIITTPDPFDGWTYQDEFTADNWDSPVGDEIEVDTDNEWFGVNVSDRSPDGQVYDLQNQLGAGNFMSDTVWLMRCTLRQTTMTQGSSMYSTRFMFGLGDSNASVSGNENQDWVGMNSQIDSTRSNWVSSFGDGEAVGVNEVVLQASDTTANKYCEFIRESATEGSVQWFSNSNFTGSINENSLVLDSTIINLRYVKGTNFNAAIPNNSTVECNFKNLQVINGQTTPP